MTIIYGIHNCDTVKKALAWLNNENIQYQFHDLRKDGLTSELLTQFFAEQDWQNLVNKRSTTYRNLSSEVKENLTEQLAFDTILNEPTLLKRPLLRINNSLHLGFKADHYQELFSL
ncbi:MAG: Spx/MgsR family RNA polymerase-binding regulatory protein [Thalassotalea sp.]